jgi:anti-sigma regulatory factor (Ser/Thr protein kinase)
MLHGALHFHPCPNAFNDRDNSMSENREKSLRMALRAVLLSAQDQGVDLERLRQAAIESMLNDIVYDSNDVAHAVIAIERAADTLAVY